MKAFFSRNIDNRGRFVRGLGAVALLVGAPFSFSLSVWLGLELAVSGLFGLIEALRGWCLLRACGIKTRF